MLQGSQREGGIAFNHLASVGVLCHDSKNLCAESSVISANRRRRPSSWTGCAGWNIAATTRRASPPSRTAKSRSANASVESRTSPSSSKGSAARDGRHLPTRWATHGGVTDENAHPHIDQSGKLALVHNGVIENSTAAGSTYPRGAHLPFADGHRGARASHRKHYDAHAGPRSKELLHALRAALKQVIGTYGLVLIHRDVPDIIVGARRGSPLVLGIGKGENFLVSDVSAIVAHTRDAVYLNDYDIVAIEREEFEITSLVGGDATYRSARWSSRGRCRQGRFPHYMLKEIYEQPETVHDAMRGRLSIEEGTAKLGGLEMTPKELRDVERIVLTGCGTAFHAAMVGEYLIETLAHMPMEVEFASEFRYRNMPMNKDTLVFVISQSGETADTLAAMRESQRKGHRTLGICNNVASTIARESDGGVYMHAGPEIGVAATKRFTSQVTILTLLGLLLGRIRHLSSVQGIEVIAELEGLPEDRQILDQNEQIKSSPRNMRVQKGMMFLGRQFNYPMALEGALKMKEISYIHAEGHPSAELKHGVIALIGPDVPSIVIAPEDSVYDKNINNIEEVKARKGPVIAIGTEGRKQIAKVADDVICIPKCPDFLSPILAVIPLQLLAYHLAVKLGCDVDKPRNLAKSVTVE